MTRDLVLLHGWGFTRRVWDPVISGLSQAYRVRNLDLPGYGERRREEYKEAAGQEILDRWSDDVAGGVPAGAVWMGWSLGATVVLNAMLRLPGAVEAAVLVASTPKFVRGDGWDAGMTAAQMRGFTEGVVENVDQALNRFLLLQAGGGDNPRTVIRTLSQSVAGRADTDIAVLEAGLRVLERTDLRSGLSGLETPVLVIHGGGDRVVPPAAGSHIARQIPRSELVVLETGHAPFVTQPRAFTEAVIAWT